MDDNYSDENLDKVYGLVDRETGQGIDLTGTEVRVISLALTSLFDQGTEENPLVALATVAETLALLDSLSVRPYDLAELARNVVTFHAPKLSRAAEDYAKAQQLARDAQYN